MTDEQALLAAIISNRDEDTPRLVYADWLDDHDRPDRAEFVRVQCEIARHERQSEWIGDPETGVYGWERINQLKRRERELWFEHGTDFIRGLPASNESPALLPDCVASTGIGSAWRYQFRRGFIDESSCSADHWLQHADAIYWHPEQKAGPLCSRCVNMPGIMSNGCQCDGRIPRPCPLTAQSLRKVRLTTMPGLVLCGHGDEYSQFGIASSDEGPVPDYQFWFSRPRFADMYDRPATIAACLAARWPGIEFELPPARLRRERLDVTNFDSRYGTGRDNDSMFAVTENVD